MKIGKIIVSFIAVSAVTVTAAFYLLNLKLNYTPSYPRGLYQVKKLSAEQLKRGDLVLVCPKLNDALKVAAERNYIHFSYECDSGFTPLMKRIVAMEGDYVEVNAKGVHVNKSLIDNSIPLKVDTKNRPMPIAKSGITPKGRIWIISEYSDVSFDSRYFGDLDIESVIGTMKPLWIEHEI